MGKVKVSCFALFLLMACSANAQRKEHYSLEEIIFREAILNHIDQYCEAYEQKDSTFFCKHYAETLFLTKDKKEEKTGGFLKGIKKICEGDQELQITVGDVKIRRHSTKPTFYGVSMLMTYKIGAYEDKGYCFWCIGDTPERPIYTFIFGWQPETTPERDRFSLEDFRLP